MPKTNFTKVCLLPTQLVALLKTRGLAIADEAKARDYLTNIGYFRLSAYFYPLLKVPKTDRAEEDASSVD